MKPCARELEKKNGVLALNILALRRRTRGASRTSGKRRTRKSIYFDEPSMTPTVLIVDENLGFVWWLGEILVKAGCTVLPALNCRDALSLAKETGIKVDLVLANPTLDGFSEMTKQLGPHYKLLTIVEVADPPA